MPLPKLLAASAIGALTFSSGAIASRGRALNDADGSSSATSTSAAKCTVVALGYSEESNKEAIAEVTQDASAFICNGETTKSAHSIATATAEAFALAVASASVECELQGDASVQVDASASATAAATVWLKAYAEAFAAAGDCDQCDVYATSYGYVEQEVFLKAVADAQVKLDAYTTGSGSLLFKVIDFETDVKTAVVEAFAEALANAADYRDAESCLAWVNVRGCIWDPTRADPDECGGFDCEATAVSAGKIEEIDAVVAASTSAEAWSCGHSASIQDLEDTAKDLAEATAVALSFAYASCEVEDGFACAIAGAEITQTAEAVADAYASLWADSSTCKDACYVSVDAVAEAVGTILVNAATEAFADVCTDGGVWTKANLAVEIEKASLCALAEASATAISIAPSTCLAGGIVYADASESSCPAH